MRHKVALTNGAQLVAVSSGPVGHFFGYYDINPWDADEKRLLGHRVLEPQRFPDSGDEVQLGIFDLTKTPPSFEAITATTAWNYQQGAMFQWVALGVDRVVYNNLQDGQARGMLRSLSDDTEVVLSRPIAALSRDGSQALSLNFGRLTWARPGYGYLGLDDPYADEKLPTDDGVFGVDMRTGDSRLLLSLPEIADVGRSPDMDQAQHFVNHLGFNPSGERICFIHLYKLPNGDVRSRLMVAANDGRDPRVLIRGMTSHYTWLSDRALLCWAGDRRLLDSGSGSGSQGTRGWRRYVPVDRLKRLYRMMGKPRWLMYRIMSDRYYIFDVETGRRSVLGEGVLMQDGHCTVSPNGRWVCVDTYPDARRQVRLGLYDLHNNRYHPVLRLHSPPELEDEIRCDLHPRWSPTGRQLCIDSAHTGIRQIYTIDVSGIVGEDGAGHPR